MKSKEEPVVPVSLNRKAYIFSASSALLLVVFGVMYQFGFTPFDELFTFALLGILATASILPFAVKGLADEDGSEESLSMFANLSTPPESEFSFETPSLRAYRKIRNAPSRIAATLVGLLILITFGGGAVISAMLASDISFEAFVVIAGLFGAAAFSLIVLFITSTMRELKLRRSFYQEVIDGLAAEGYHPVRSFNAEYTDDRRVLLRSDDEHYSWWKFSFTNDKCEAVWEGSDNGSKTWNTTQTGPIQIPHKKNRDTL